MQFIICLVVLTVLLHTYCSVMAQRQHPRGREPTWVSLYYNITKSAKINHVYSNILIQQYLLF